MPRVLEAFAAHFGYGDALNGPPTTQTPAQFTRDQVKNWIREVTRTYEEQTAVRAAREAAAQNPLTF